MNRVIVSIISEQTIPNYIFIKENFQIGDELLFVSSKTMASKIENITSTLGYPDVKSVNIILDDNEEERWFRMCSKIREPLKEETKYIVNLTGGTKYMSMAILRVFEDYESEFYYIPFPKNEMLILKKDHPQKLSYRVSINEYLSLYNVSTEGKHNLITKTEEVTSEFFNVFVNRHFSQEEFQIIDKLRDYRNCGIKDIITVETNLSTNEKKRQIIGLKEFLIKQKLLKIDGNQLTKYDVQYLTGGWFEEYVYNRMKQDIKPQDIALGLKIKRTLNPFANDLDVVFTLGNKLFVIECKTGILDTKMFNETVYKATALKETLFGLPGNTFIFSLGVNDEKFEQTAKNMGITYYDRSFFTDEKKWEALVDRIKGIAKN
jgi:hypothetical protein